MLSTFPILTTRFWPVLACLIGLSSSLAQAQLHQPTFPPAPPLKARNESRPPASPSPLLTSPPTPYSSSVPQAPAYQPIPGTHTFSTPHAFEDPALPAPGQHPLGIEPAPAQPHRSNYLSQAPYPSQSCLDYLPGCGSGDGPWTWTLLPNDVLWKSYVAGPREPRFASEIVYREGTGWLWELQSGGRAGLWRYGTINEYGRPEGWQMDVWGAALPRLDFETNPVLEVEAVDFKVGVPITWTNGPWQMKFEWYHISSHLGDEFLLRNPGFPRIDYLRDSLVFATGYFPHPDLRLYSEIDYAYNTNGGAKPWHFQLGMDYSPICPTGFRGPKPFFAVNALFREEVNFSGSLNITTGYQWKGLEKEGIFRAGFRYYNGQSPQLSFLNAHEELYGFGLWYDF